MVEISTIISEYDVIEGDGGVENGFEIEELRRFRRVRVRRRRGGVVHGVGSGGTGSFFRTKSFGGGGSVAMLANGGHALSSCPSGLTCWLSAAPEVRMAV